MIDLLINKRTRLPVVAKPAGSKWGRRERNGPNLCVVHLHDPPTKLAARIAKRGVVANPFAEHENRPQWTGGPPRRVMVRQSTIKLRSADVRQDARVRMANTIDGPILPAGQLEI